MSKETHFFIRKTITNKSSKKEESHRIGVVVINLDDSLIEIAASICSPEDSFDEKTGLNMARGRLFSKTSKHVCAVSVDEIFNMNFQSMMNKIGFSKVKANGREYPDPLQKHITYGNGSKIDFDKLTIIFKRAVGDLTGIKDSL